MKSILLVEDDQKLALAISIRLKSMGHKVVSANDAVTAVTQAKKTQPDVIVMDVNLPGGDGFEVASRLRVLADTSMIPMIFITASKQPGLQKRADAVGAVAFLEKPFSAAKLADAIEKCSLQACSLTDELG